jgi:LysM repeat protein
MKEPNPLLPQGSFEAQGRGKSHVRIAVFTILAIHVVVLGALLIQGCKREEKADTAASGQSNDFNSVPPFGGASNEVVTPADGNPPGPGSNLAPMPGVAATASNVAPLPVPQQPVVPQPVPQPPVVPEVAGTEHTIVKGDTFAGLAQKYGVTVKAIQAANPGVDPAKLKLGQKVKIPAKTATAAMTSNGTTGGTTASDTYVVKSGDTLAKVAKDHATTIKAIQKLNNLTTTQIRVGQKLKLPSRATAPATATPNPVTPGGAPPAGGTVPPLSPAPAQ